MAGVQKEAAGVHEHLTQVLRHATNGFRNAVLRANHIREQQKARECPPGRVESGPIPSELARHVLEEEVIRA